jgi:hypothetical protein
MDFTISMCSDSTEPAVTMPSLFFPNVDDLREYELSAWLDAGPEDPNVPALAED